MGIEPTTTRLKAERSTAELTGINNLINNQIVLKSFSIYKGIEPLGQESSERSTGHVEPGHNAPLRASAEGGIKKNRFQPPI